MGKKTNLLITGGAGFIGSNLVEHFIQDERTGLVRVLDDLSNGDYENIRKFEKNPKFEFIKGDICDYNTCMQAKFLTRRLLARYRGRLKTRCEPPK